MSAFCKLIFSWLAFACCAVSLIAAPVDTPSDGKGPIPVREKVVVLTFDDASKSHFTIVRPILKKYGFGATFFITEGFDFPTNKRDYMSWEEIAQLHRDGFEIGNHTRDHLGITAKNAGRLPEQLEAIAKRCQEHGLPKPVSFAWPGNSTAVEAFAALHEAGIRFARRGGGPEYPYKNGRGFAYEPGLDHPLLIPSAGDARPDWELEDLQRAVAQAQHGKIAVLQFHGAPDTAHSWVNTPRDKFELFMRYLAKEKYQVIAMRDLKRFQGTEVAPRDPQMVIRDRQKQIASGKLLTESRPAGDEASLKRWLEQMLVQHQYTATEAAASLGMRAEEVSRKAQSLGIVWEAPPKVRNDDGSLVVLPYPGGRHPRIGFRDGAIRPQRETKVSVFAPWQDGGYVVVDVPEAIWHAVPPGRKLLYLAHTHVETIWDAKGVALPPQEWNRTADGTLTMNRELPNGVAFGAEVRSRRDGVAMELWIRNGSAKTLSGLNVQNCVMLKAASGFAATENDNANKVFDSPFAACRDESGRRWVVTAWSGCQRPWGNVHCPCLHADPKFDDCPPGETRRLQGWVSFYEGQDIRAEFQRLRESFAFLR